MLNHIARQQGFGRLFHPLTDQDGDFATQIGGAIQFRQLERLQGRRRSGTQIFSRGNESSDGHEQSPFKIIGVLLNAIDYLWGTVLVGTKRV